MIECGICDQVHRLGGEPASPDEAAAIGEFTAKAIRDKSDMLDKRFLYEPRGPHCRRK
jgi:hypothetical protein